MKKHNVNIIIEIVIPILVVVSILISFFNVYYMNQQMNDYIKEQQHLISGYESKIDYLERQNKTMGKLLENAGIYYKDFLD